jgi:flagellar motility protein MotE (MotC chaperone)
MNPGEIAVLIVAIVMIASIFKSRHRYRHPAENPPQERSENLRLREEVAELKERIKVLERITVEKENSLSREIEDLRDR